MQNNWKLEKKIVHSLCHPSICNKKIADPSEQSSWIFNAWIQFLRLLFLDGSLTAAGFSKSLIVLKAPSAVLKHS